MQSNIKEIVIYSTQKRSYKEKLNPAVLSALLQQQANMYTSTLMHSSDFNVSHTFVMIACSNMTLSLFIGALLPQNYSIWHLFLRRKPVTMHRFIH